MTRTQSEFLVDCGEYFRFIIYYFYYDRVCKRRETPLRKMTLVPVNTVEIEVRILFETFVRYINPHNAEIFVCKQWRPKGVFFNLKSA